MSNTLNNRSILSAASELSHKWGWFVALGIVLIVLGGIAFGNLLMATVVTVYYIGILMLIAGIVEIIHAFSVKGWKSFTFWFLSGLLYAAAGVIAFINPVLTAGVLTILLAAALIAAGFFRIWMGFQAKPTSGWGWIVTAGIITALAGLIIAMQWPVNSLFILGMFLSIDLIFQGWTFIAFGFGLKSARK